MTNIKGCHAIEKSLDNFISDKTMELSLKSENSHEGEFIENFGGDAMKMKPAAAHSVQTEVEIESCAASSSSAQERNTKERPANAPSAANSADIQSDLSFDNDLQCKICNRYFRSMHTLAQHVRFHAVKSYKCSTCNKVFSIKASFQQHACKHATIKSFDCGICDASFMDQGSWKRHKERHFGVRNHSCDICGMAFYEKYSLRVHQTSHFYTSLKSEKDINSGFTCHICQKYFKTKKDMKNHLVAHSTKKYTCEFCNKRFSLKFSYVRHRRIHTGERPFKCGTCDRAFSDGSAWSKHVKIHSGIKPYNCDICLKAFFNQFSCNTHKKSCGKAKDRSRESKGSKFSDLYAQMSRRSNQTESQRKESDKVDFEVSDSESQIGTEDISFSIGNGDKDFGQSKLMDSGFDAGFLDENEQVRGTKKSPSNDPMFTAVVENVKQDKKFQKDFVERHMPDKPFDSESEFLSSNFPEGTEMLDNDTYAFTENEVDGNETEDQSDSNDIFPESNRHHKPSKAQSTPKSNQTRRKRTSRKPYRFVPESPSKCQRCNKTFKTDSNLKQHQKVHCMLKKLYKCRYCGRQLSSNSGLARHERIHTGEKPYECYICQKGFADKSGCIRHIRHHLSTTSRLSIIKPMKESQVGDPCANAASFTESTGITNQDSSVYEQCNQQAMRLDANENANENKEHIKNDLKLEYKNDSYEETKTFGEDLEIGTEIERHLSTSEIDNSVGIPQANDEDPLVVDSCWSENLGIETDNQSYEETTENQNPELDSKERETETNKQHLNSGANLYRCGFCGLLFDSEDNCGIHISQDCLSYRNSVSEAVESISSSALSNTNTPQSLNTDTLTLPLTTNTSAMSLTPNSGKSCSTYENVSLATTQSPVTSERVGFVSFSSLQQMAQMSNNVSTNTSAANSLLNIQQPPISGQKPKLICTNISSQATQGSSNVRLLLTDPVQKSLLATVRLQPNQNTAGQMNISSQSKSAVSLLNTNAVSKISANSATFCLVPTSQINKAVSNNSPLLSATSGNKTPASPNIQTTTGPNEQMTLLLRTPSLGGKPNSLGGKPKSFGGKPKTASALQNKCLVCGKTFKNKHTLKQHSAIHQDRKFPCDYCTKKFHNKYGYQRHLRIHTQEKPYTCANCGRGFTDKSHLLKHSRNCLVKETGH